MRFTDVCLMLPFLLVTVIPSLKAQAQSAKSEVSLLETMKFSAKNEEALAVNENWKQRRESMIGYMLLEERRYQIQINKFISTNRTKRS